MQQEGSLGNSGRQPNGSDSEGVGGDQSPTPPTLTEDKVLSSSQGSGDPPSKQSNMEEQQTGGAPDPALEEGPKSKAKKAGARTGPPSDMDLLKERFAKLLLGEDMSGGGTGVSSALALSNAITNLAASVFGEQSRLEPMSEERKTRWKKEIDWLLSVTDYIVEFVPSLQTSEDGRNMEIMITQQRKDLRMNIPALKKLDAMLIGYLDNFKGEKEFWYLSRDAAASEKGNAGRADDKWWLPTVKVPDKGLSEESRKWIQHQKELVNQVLKAAMAINANTLMEMEIPEDYIESLPKNGRSSLGESIYKYITDEGFDADAFLETIDLSTEHRILDLKNRIEASVVIWRRKMNNKEVKSSWVSGVSGISSEKREQFEDRAETILLILKHRFPGIPQSSLDISKIQYNKNVGLAILESYSRVLESVAFTVMSRIDDVLRADSLAQAPAATPTAGGGSVQRKPPEEEASLAAGEETIKLNKMQSNDSMTLSDIMDWDSDQDCQAKDEEPETAVVKAAAPPPPPAPAAKKATAANRRFGHIERLVLWE